MVCYDRSRVDVWDNTLIVQLAICEPIYRKYLFRTDIKNSIRIIGDKYIWLMGNTVKLRIIAHKKHTVPISLS